MEPLLSPLEVAPDAEPVERLVEAEAALVARAVEVADAARVDAEVPELDEVELPEQPPTMSVPSTTPEKPRNVFNEDPIAPRCGWPRILPCSEVAMRETRRQPHPPPVALVTGDFNGDGSLRRSTTELGSATLELRSVYRDLRTFH